jgi:endonuclease YncB( thermonuclease family)
VPTVLCYLLFLPKSPNEPLRARKQRPRRLTRLQREYCSRRSSRPLRTTSSLPIAQFLLREGWAELPIDVTDQAYVEASELAHSRGLGIWGDAPP